MDQVPRNKILGSLIIILLSSYTENLTDGCWSPTRPSVFFTARQDGVLDAWDVLYQQKAPILSTKVADDALNCMKVHEQVQIYIITLGSTLQYSGG